MKIIQIREMKRVLEKNLVRGKWHIYCPLWKREGGKDSKFRF